MPLSAAEREQLAADAIDGALGRAPGPALGAAGAARSSEPAPKPPAGGAVLRPRTRIRAVGAAVAASVALAAAVALYVRGGSHPVEPLARYTMLVEGEQRTRGAPGPAATPGEPVTLRPETRLVVRLAAEQPERDALVRLVLVRDGHATVLDPPITRGKAGALEIAGPTTEIVGTQRDGPAELVVVVGRALPADEEIRALALRGPGDAQRALQVMRQAVMLEGFSHAAIDVLLGGCSAVLGAPGARNGGSPTCEIGDGARLHLWVGVPVTAAVAVDLDGQAVEPQAVPRGGGAAFELDVPAHARLLSVRVEAREIAAWQIAPARGFAQVRASDEARRAGRLDEAIADLDAIASEAAPEERLEAVRRRAKIARLRGEADRERERREQAVALARSLGRVSAESDETVAILYGLIDQHALAQAARLLPALDVHGMIYAEGAVRRDLVRGRLASELGDLGAALGSFQRALALADRIGDATDRAFILGPLADVLQSLGRNAEALPLIDAELQRGSAAGDVCARIDAITSAGWLLRDIDPLRAQRLADQAADLAAASCERLVPITLVNQGWLLAAARRFGEARGVLSRIARVRQERDGRVTTWALRLEAETVLGEDPARAEQHARHLAARAAELCSTELLYEAHLLRARALAALDRPDQAAAAFAEAERALTLWSRLVPLGEGRDTFFARQDQLALTAIPFFLGEARRGKPDAGLALAATVRRGIARFVTSLAGGGQAHARAERGDADRDATSRQFEQTLARWPASLGANEHPGEAVAGVCEARDAAAHTGEESQLREPPAHAALFVHPAPRGLLVLAWRGSSVEFREIPRGGLDERPEALSARIAQAAAPMLAGAPRVHLYVHRSLAALPIDHSLDRSLVRTLAPGLIAQPAVPIAFAVDAPSRPAAACAGPRRALLVPNPQGNLWAASASAPKIQRDLARLGFVVDRLEGAAATRAAIVARLTDPCTALFQYDGHGIAAARRETSGGHTGGVFQDRTDDALLLTGGDLLTAADVLGLPRVPEAVVLNGCTTAAPEGLGLAQAFLLAGAAQVVASLDEIPADDAARFTRQLFDGALPSAASVDLVSLFARAMSGMEIPALRVFER